MSSTIRKGPCSFIKSGLIKGTTSTYTTTVTTEVTIDGKYATALTAQTNAATPTTDASTLAAFRALSANKATVLVVGINVAGEIKMCQGGIEDTAAGVTTTVGAFINPPQFPSLPNDFCPLGYALVRTAPDAASWVPGAGSWTASGVTASQFVQVDGTLPDRPQSS